MRQKPQRWLRLVRLAVCWLVLLSVLILPPPGPQPAAAREIETIAGEWVWLTERFAEVERTGWAGIGYDSLPTRDLAFRTDRPITLGGVIYPRGMGVYPYSELHYRLDRAYLAFTGLVGLDGFHVPPAAVLRFRVVGDGVVLWDSGPVRPGETRRFEALPVRGVEALRLVTIDETNGKARSPGAWADLRLLPARAVTRKPESFAAAIRSLEEQQAVSQAAWQQRSQAEARLVDSYARPGEPEVLLVDQGRSVLIVTDRLAARLALEGASAGALTVLDRTRSRLVIDGARTAVLHSGGDGRVLRTGLELRFDQVYSTQVADSEVGPLSVAQVGFWADDGRYYLWLEVGVATQQPTLWHRATLYDELGQPVPVTVDPFGANAQVYFGQAPHLLLDDGRLRDRAVAPDGLAVGEILSVGKPAMLWDSRGEGGLAAIVFDETPRPPRLWTELTPGQVAGRLRLEYERQDTIDNEEAAGTSLLLQIGADPRRPESLAGLRDALRRRYPQRPPPEWARFQWISWYAWYLDVTDDKLRTQVDAIAARFADLGPWHVVVDAGWYIAEGRPGADWRAVDPEKFPRGLTSFVDYAHAQDVAVVLYFSTPHLDTREYPGDWLGLPGTVEQLEPELIQLGTHEGGASYLFDYDNPQVLAYLEQVMDDFFLEYGVDGLQLDGLGNVDSAGIEPELRNGFGIVERVVADTLDIYRFHAEQVERRRPDALIQAGWDTPVFANPYAHSFWYGDDTMRFRHPYPHPGLYEKIEYALYQALVLGQRPQFGSIYLPPAEPSINEQWLAAALTIGAPMGISFELDQLAPATTARYRLLLNRYEPWGDGVTADRVLAPTCFARRIDDVWAVSVINEAWEAVERTVRLRDCGVELDGDAAGIDLISWQPVRAQRGVLPVRLDAESVHTFLLRSTEGMLTSSSRFEPEEDGWIVSGPLDVPGVTYLVIDQPPSRVLIDDEPLPWEQIEYDPRTLVATVRYEHTGAPQYLRVE